MISTGFSLGDVNNGFYKKPQYAALGYTPSALKAQGYTITQLIQSNNYLLSDLSSTSFTNLEYSAVNYGPADLFNAGYTTARILTIGFTLPSFMFRLATNAWNNVCPIRNPKNSFTGLHMTSSNSNGTTIVTVYWISYLNRDKDDGLRFNTNVSYYNNSTLNILQFGGVPLANMTGTSNGAFFRFAGTISANDAPTIPNNSLHSCFHSATCGRNNFGRLDLWQTSAVISMNSTFNGARNFKTNVASTWSFRGVKPRMNSNSVFNIIRGTAFNTSETSRFLTSLRNSTI
jgi:hypothetical protein